MEKDTITRKLDRETALLTLISKFYRIDLLSLFLLHEELGDKLFLLFYMLQGKKLNIPATNKFTKLDNNAKRLCFNVKNNVDLVEQDPQLEEVRSLLLKHYNSTENTITLNLQDLIYE